MWVTNAIFSYMALSFYNLHPCSSNPFFSDPNIYKKVINLVTGSNSCDPTMTRDALLAMLKGKKELTDQVQQ